MPFIDPREDFGYELREQRQPTFRSVSHRPRPAPVWYGGGGGFGGFVGGVSGPSLADLLGGLVSAGIDPARLGLGQQQPRTIQTTDPGAGYGQSPSGPTAQMPVRQLRQVPGLRPYTGADQIGQQIAGYGMPPRNIDYGVGSASAPWAVGPPRGPKPMSPLFEGPQPTIEDRLGYLRSPSNPNWRPPGE